MICRFRNLHTMAVAVLLATVAVFGLGASKAAADSHSLKVAAVFETPIEEPWVNQIHVARIGRIARGRGPGPV